MTRQEKCIAIAIACGWKREGSEYHLRPRHRIQYDGSIKNDWESKGPHDCLRDPKGEYHWICDCRNYQGKCHEPLPDYFGSLDAMHEAEKCLPELTERGPWRMRLEDICGTMKAMLHATAEQRAESFGIAMSLWKEGE